MRIRSIKPEFFTHPEIVTLSVPARLLFLSLLGQADDEGRLYDQPTKIRGEAFGEKDRVNVPGLLSELAENGRIHRYEVGPRKCIQIVNFSVHQRVSHASRSRIPPEPSPKVGRVSPVTLRPDLGSREQGAGNGTGNLAENGKREVRTALKDALVEASDWDRNLMTASNWGAVEKAAKEAEDGGYSPEDVKLTAELFRQTYRDATVTPLAIVRAFASVPAMQARPTRRR